MTPVTALVLAGSRGAKDPIATMAEFSHKALVPVFGTAMLQRVVDTLLESGLVGRILIAIEAADLVREIPRLAALMDEGRVAVLPAAASPARSVLAGLQAAGTPLLVTTADHALLTAEMVQHFWNHLPAGCDAAAGLARAQTILAAYPDTQRTWLRFAGLKASGCNLFAFRSAAATGVVEFWQQVEAERKKPHRMVGLLGPILLVRYVLGLLSLDAALAALGRRAGARLGWVDMPQAEAAIDIDKPSDLKLATKILARRRFAGG